MVDGAEHVYHLYVIKAPDRDRVQAYLSEAGIATGIHYPIPIHLQPAFQDLGYRLGDFPITERYSNEILSLPMYPELKEEAIGRVSARIKASLTTSIPQIDYL